MKLAGLLVDLVLAAALAAFGVWQLVEYDAKPTSGAAAYLAQLDGPDYGLPFAAIAIGGAGAWAIWRVSRFSRRD